MKDYLSAYAEKPVAKFQAGGQMPAEGAPAQGGSNIEAMLQQYAQSRDPQLAVQICDTILASLGGGGGAAAPAMRTGGRMEVKTPVFKKGGKLKV
jgi:hypothetical protein